MNPRVQKLIAQDDYTLILTFTNGEIRCFDMSPYLQYTVFQPLRNIAFFKLARPAHGTVEWPGEIDFAPDTLYLDSYRPASPAG